APLVVDVVGARILDEREAHGRLEEMRLSPPEAGRGREPGQPAAGLATCARLWWVLLLVRLEALDRRDHAAAILAPLLLLGLQVLGETRLRDDAADLRRDGAEEADLVAREAPAPERLHDQHADRHAALDDRHAEEGMVLLLARLREELVAGMRDGIDRHHRLELLDRHAGEAFLDAHRDLADGAPLETRRGPEGQALRPLIED